MKAKRISLGAGLLLLGLALPPTRGTVVSTRTVAPFAERTRVAVPPFRNLGTADPSLSRKLGQGLTKDLEVSGYFDPIRTLQWVEQLDREDLSKGRIDFREWYAIKAELLVKATYAFEGDALKLEVRLYRTAEGRNVFAKAYRGAKTRWRDLLRNVADDIVREMTGKAGIANTLIALTSARTGEKQIYIVRPDGSGLQRVTARRGICLSPDWAPGGSRIVYTAYWEKRPCIYMQTLATGKVKKIAGFAGLNAFPCISPDGKKMLLTLSRAGNPEIFIMDLRTGDLQRLTRTAATEASPCWAPDGKRIAFVSDRSGRPQIYLMRIDGGGVTRLTHEGSYNTSPAWSPDGRQIAYCSRAGGNFDLYTVDVTTRRAKRMTASPESEEDPSWAPDGVHLAFSSSSRYRSDIHTMNIVTGERQRVTSGGNNTSPAWSPRLKR